MKILSLQSAVAYGHVGNSAAVFPLQRLGFEVWPVDTVQFSNHPGHGQWGGAVMAADHVRAVVDGLSRLGALADCDAVLSGYVGEAATGPAVLEAVARVRRHKAGALFLCDPVMGDEGGLYVRDGVPEFLAAQALPAADVITPNRFELETLSGRPVPGMAEAAEAARALLARGPRVVAVTSLGEGPSIACLTVTAEGAWAVRTPHLAFDPPVSGTGDVLSALLLAHLLRGEAAPEALSLAVSSLYGVLEKTRALGRNELALVQAQDEIALPSRLFPPLPV
ncbi:MAG: pyridoxal kinase PdxY [Bacteroidales bacterium]